MLPLRRLPPAVGPPETEIVKVSVAPGSPLSITLTVNVHGAPSLVHAPPKVAVLPAITKEPNARAVHLRPTRVIDVLKLAVPPVKSVAGDLRLRPVPHRKTRAEPPKTRRTT